MYRFYIPFFVFSLKMAINNNPASWKDDSTWLQDLINPNMNAAANIAGDEIIAFQRLCKLSAKILRECMKTNGEL